MPAKRCSKCGEDKPLSEFFNNRSHKDGKSNYCKECHTAEGLKRAATNGEIKRKYYWNNREKEIANSKKRYARRKDILKPIRAKWRAENKDYMTAYHKQWYAANRYEKLKRNADWEREARKSDPIFRLRKSMRIRVYNAIKHNVKSASTELLIGCTIKELVIHLESKFVNGMAWNNYGPVWHVDHIKPCSLFDLSIPDEQRKCFHYTNLQPLFALDNMKKHNKY